MKNANHMAVDIGAGSGRAFVGRLGEGRLTMEEVHRFRTDDMAWRGRHVRNLYRWYDDILEGFRRYAAVYEAPLASVGVDTFGTDFVLLDRFGDMIGLPTSYRYAALPQAAFELESARFGSEQLYALCGNHSMKNDALLQLIAMSLDREEPLSRADCLLFLADLFHYLLCGRRCAEVSLASYAKLYNQRSHGWEDRIFEAFDLPKRLQTPIVHSGDVLGKLAPEICADVGLGEPPDVIAPAGHDTACAAFAVPDSDPGAYFISSGSWSLVGLATERAILTRDAWAFNASNSAMPIGANLFKKNVAGMWIAQRCQREWGGIAFEEIASRAERVTNNAFHVDVDDERLFNPPSMTRAVCELAGEQGAQLAPDDVGAVARICFESLALKYRYAIRNLERISGQAARAIYIVGGGSRNALINQLTADACGVPVMAGLDEASAVGNLLMQMYGHGEIDSAEEAKAVVRRSFAFQRYTPSAAGTALGRSPSPFQ